MTRSWIQSICTQINLLSQRDALALTLRWNLRWHRDALIRGNSRCTCEVISMILRCNCENHASFLLLSCSLYCTWRLGVLSIRWSIQCCCSLTRDYSSQKHLFLARGSLCRKACGKVNVNNVPRNGNIHQIRTATLHKGYLNYIYLF